jgi:hypothetical protein
LNVTTDNLLAVNAQLRLETTAANKDSVADIQTIVGLADDAIALIEEYNNGDGDTVLTHTTATGQKVLTKPDYEAAGIIGVTDANLVAVNAMILGASTSGADTVEKIQTLVNNGIQAQLDAIAKITAYADTVAVASEGTPGDPDTKEVQQLNPGTLIAGASYTLRVGNTTLESAALDDDPTVGELLAAFQADGGYDLAAFILEESSSPPGLLEITFKNTGDQAVLASLRSERPVLADYVTAGVTGLEDNELYAANDRVEQLASSQLGTLASLQAVEGNATTVQDDALQVVLDYAANNTNPKPSVRTYKLAGLTAVSELTLAAVNKVVDTKDSASLPDFATAETVVNAGVQVYKAALKVLSDYATEAANAVVPQLSDYQDAGVTGLLAGDVAMINALLIQKKQADTGSATTTTGIQAIVNEGLAAIFKIRDAAESNTATSDGLVAADYQAVGIPAADIVDIDALNDALDSVGVTGADVRIYSGLTAVVGAVKKVSELADGGTGDAVSTAALSVADLDAMGVSGVDPATSPEPAEQVARLAIMNAVLDDASYGDVDRVAEVQAIHDAAQAVLRTAQGQTPVVSKAQLGLLGFDLDNADSDAATPAITNTNLSAIQQVLINLNLSSDFSALDDFTKLATLVSDAVAAMAVIEAAAGVDDDSAITTITGISTFSDMGITTVTTSDSVAGTANNLDTLKTILAGSGITDTGANTYEKVKAIVDSLNVVFAYAEGGATEPELGDYQALGLSDISTAPQLSLLNALISSYTDRSEIGTAAKLQAKATAVNHVMLTAAVADVAGIDAAVSAGTFDDHLTTTDLEALGFTYVNTAANEANLTQSMITNENLDSVRLAIANSANDLSGVQDYTALKNLVETTAKAANTIQAYGAADSASATPVPTPADYAAVGVTGVTDENVAAINSSLATDGVLDTISASVAAEVQDIVDIWAKVQTLADGEADTVSTTVSFGDIVPAFTTTGRASATQNNFTVSTDKPYATDSHLISRAFDNTAAIFASATNNAGPVNVYIAADAAYQLAAFTVKFPNSSLYAKTVKFFRSNDNSTWAEVESFSAVPGENFFSLSTTAQDYRYFRIEFSDINQSSQNNIDVEEIELLRASNSYIVDNIDGKDDDVGLVTASEFASLGIKSVAAGTPNLSAEAALFLNQIIDERSLDVVADVSKIAALSSAIEKLLSTADVTNGSITAALGDVTWQELNLLGLSLIDSTNVASVLTYLKGSGGANYRTLDHFVKVKADIVANLSNISQIALAAELNTATAAYPTLEQWKTINALDGDTANDVIASTLAAMNSLLNTPNVTGAVVEDTTKLRGLVGLYNQVLAAADGGSSSTSLALTAANYADLGITGLDTTTSPQPAAQTAKLAIVNAVIEGRAKTAVDSIAEVQTLFDAATALLRTVEGKAPAVTKAQLGQLGFDIDNADGNGSTPSVTDNNLSAIQKALTDKGVGTDYDTVDSLSDVQTIVHAAVNALDAIAAAAANGANNATFAVGTAFTDAGIEGVDASNISLINSIFNTAAVDAANANTLEKVQSLVDVADKVVSLAGNAAAAKLTVADLAKVGITVTRDAELSLVNDLLIDDSTAQTSVAEIQAFFTAVVSILDDAAAAVDGTLDSSKADLAALGFDTTTTTLVDSSAALPNVTTLNHPIIRQAIAATADDLSGVNRLSKLKNLVEETAKAANKIANYTATASSSTPTAAGLVPSVEDFEAIFVDDVDSTNITALRDALADDDVSVGSDLTADIQSVVDSYNKVLHLADATDNVLGNGDSAEAGFEAASVKPTATDYTNLGVSLNADASIEAAQVALMGDVIDLKSASAVDTVAEIQAIADAVAAVMNTAQLSSTSNFATAGVDRAQLELLGFTQITDDNLASVRKAIANANSDDTSLAEIDSLSELQELVQNVVNAVEVLAAYADSQDNQVPSVATYGYAGFDVVNDDNLFAVNRALAEVERVEADDFSELQSIVADGIAAFEAAVAKIAKYSQEIVAGANNTVINSGNSNLDADAQLIDATPRSISVDLSNKLTAGEGYTLRVGSHTLVANAINDTATSTLVAALKSTSGYQALPFEVSASGSELVVTWRQWGATTDLIELRSEQPLLQDYELAGADTRTNTTITEEQIYPINGKIEDANLTVPSDASSLATALNGIDSAALAGIAAQSVAVTKIDNFAKDNTNSVDIPSIEDFALTGLVGVSVLNVNALRAQIKLAENAQVDSANSLGDLRGLLTKADAALVKIDTYARAQTAVDLGEGQTELSLSDYKEIGQNNIVEDNVVAINQALKAAASTATDSELEVDLVVRQATLLQARALQLLDDYGKDDNANTPIVQTYNDAAISGVTVDNIDWINGRVASLADAQDLHVNNDYILGSQTQPAITYLTNGGWVVVWIDESQRDGSSNGVFLQAYDVDGQEIRLEQQVNTYNIGDQSLPQVTPLADGGWVLAWTSNQDPNNGGFGIYTQRFDAQAQKIGVETLVNRSYTTDNQYVPDIATLADGGWLVAYSSWMQDGSSYGIYQQRYDQYNNPIAANELVNSLTTGSQYKPKVAGLNDGGWVVVWYDNTNDSAGNGVFLQRYNSDGTKSGSQVGVNSTSTADQEFPSVSALNNGGWVVVWADNSAADSDGSSVMMQRFGADGAADGAETIVNTYTTSNQENAVVETLADGSFVVVWESLGQDGSADGIYQQRFAEDGSRIGGENFVTGVTLAEQKSPAITALPNGDWIISWASDGNTAQDNSNYGIFQKRFSALTGKAVVNDLNLSSEGQELVDISLAAYAKVISFIGSDGSSPLTSADYQLAGILGVTSDNVDMINGWLVSADPVDFGTQSAIASLVFDGLTAIAKINSWAKDNSNINQQPTVEDYQAAQVTGINGGNVALVNAQVSTIEPEAYLVYDTNVNTGNQRTSDTTLLSDGGWITTWVDTNGYDGNSLGIFQQRYDLYANPVPVVSQVNTYTTNIQDSSQVTALKDGGWVVTWHSFQDGNGTTYGIYQQAFDELGRLIGVEQRVNTRTVDWQISPKVTAVSDGGWVVVWSSANQDGNNYGVYQQRFDRNGQAIGQEMQVNVETQGDQIVVNIESFDDGGWLVTWVSQGQDGDGNGAIQQRFDANGDKIGSEVVVNTTTTGNQSNPSSAISKDGGWVVVWVDESGSNDFDGASVVMQRFAANGDRVGSETRVNSYQTSNQTDADVAFLPDGSFVVTWISSGQDANGWGVYMQRFSSEGVRVGEETRVADTRANDQTEPNIIAMDNGDWIITWTSVDDIGGNGSDIYQKRFSGLTGKEISGSFDATAEVQAVVDATNKSLQKILSFANAEITSAPSVNDYLVLNNEQLTTYTVPAVNYLIQEAGDAHLADSGFVASYLSSVLTVLDQKIQYLEDATVNGTAAELTPEDYFSVGITTVNEANIAAINTKLVSKKIGVYDSVQDIRFVVDSAVRDYNEATSTLQNFATNGDVWDRTGDEVDFTSNGDGDYISSGYYSVGTSAALAFNDSLTGERWVSSYEDIDGQWSDSANFSSWIGYVDTQETQANDLLNSVTIYPFTNSNWNDFGGTQTLESFIVEGYDAATRTWHYIDRITETSNMPSTGVTYTVQADRPFDGFRLVVEEVNFSFWGTDRVEIQEIEFNTIPANFQVTAEHFTNMGVEGLTDDNHEAVLVAVGEAINAGLPITAANIQDAVTKAAAHNRIVKSLSGNDFASKLNVDDYHAAGYIGVEDSNIAAVTRMLMDNVSEGGAFTDQQIKQAISDANHNIASIGHLRTQL